MRLLLNHLRVLELSAPEQMVVARLYNEGIIKSIEYVNDCRTCKNVHPQACVVCAGTGWEIEG